MKPDSFDLTPDYEVWPERERLNPALLRILDAIDEALVDPVIARDLSNILSALRGPDSGDNDLKSRTTAHIRQMAFPQAFDHGNTGWARHVDRLTVPSLYGSEDHFDIHIAYALKVFGIER